MIKLSGAYSNRELLAVAVVAALFEEDAGSSIGPSIGRNRGKSWSEDHRRMALGKGTILKSKSERSSRR